jgi:hypothetical protein
MQAQLPPPAIEQPVPREDVPAPSRGAGPPWRTAPAAPARSLADALGLVAYLLAVGGLRDLLPAPPRPE